MKKEINPYQRSEWANTFSFHDFKNQDIKVHDFFNYIASLFQEHGSEPTQMAFYSSNYATKNLKTYKNERKKIEIIDEKEISNIQLDATSFATIGNGHEICTLYFNREKFGYCILVFDEQFFKFIPEKVKSICQNIINFLSPAYAYMFRREFKKGPVWYPMGVINGIPFNDPEEDIIDKWGKMLSWNEYKTGDLRDIYPIQMVMDAHLDRVVLKNMTLLQFIESTPDHGRLESLDDAHYLWWVDEKNISDVREKLRPSGLMIAV